MICTGCELDKSAEEFYQGKKYVGFRCKRCRIQAVQIYSKNNPVRTNLARTRIRARKKNMDFDLDTEFVENLWKEQGGRCALSGLPFTPYRQAVNLPFTPSLDRIDSKKGYTKDNVRFILFALNTAIGNNGVETYLEIAKAVMSRQQI